MLKINPQEVSIAELHGHLLGAVGPRPIALTSTVDSTGNPNLSPYSFFNVFSANPPIAIFSPARRIRNNTTKDTLENIKKNKEVVINIVSEEIVEKSVITSADYPKEIDEFIESGLTPIPSKKIKPCRVKESPVQMECQVKKIIELGEDAGSGALIICKILLIHISQHILDNNNNIDPNKIKLIGRLGGKWYCKGFDQALFTIEKPT